MYRKLFDSHIHSENSPDGSHSVMCICEKAAELGMKGVAITDHFDLNDLKEYGYLARIEQSVFDIQKAQAVLGKNLMISLGVELGQPAYDPKIAGDILEQYPFDFVLCSLHAMLGNEDFYFWDYSASDINIGETVRAYFAEMLDIVKWGNFDAIGHFNYLVRYVWGRHRIPINFEDYNEVIDPILKLLAETGKGMEINTSGLRSGMGQTMPNLPILKRFRELGGEIVTIGSDAHLADDVGAGGGFAMDILKQAGFTHYTYFRERKPHMISLD